MSAYTNLDAIWEQNLVSGMSAPDERIEWLLDSFRPGNVAFLVSTAPGVPEEWLTAARLEAHLQLSLMEPIQFRIARMTGTVWAISMQVAGDAESPANALQAHALRRALLARMEADWNGTTSAHVPDRTPALEGTENGGEAAADAETEEIAFTRGARLAMSPLPGASFTIRPISLMSAMESIEGNIAELNALLEIIVNKQLHTQFQPILSLRDGQIFGHEALIRGPKGALLRRPGALFHAADKARMVAWFDIACQEQCFAQAAANGLKKLLFVNMDAEGLAYLDFHDRSLAFRAQEHGLSPTSIVVEITERQTMEDFPRLLHFVGRLREQGFKIAIDDAGAGYSSLQAIARLRPDFVKIDRALVKNLDVNGENRALLGALNEYARQIGTTLLAEGFESREELAALIELGIPYGQGFFAGKPADALRGIPRDTKELIVRCNQRRDRLRMGYAVSIGELIQPGFTLGEDAPLLQAAQKFARDPGLTSVVMLQDENVRGLLMRDQLEHVLDLVKAAKLGELLPSDTVGQWMRTNMLCTDQSASILEVARQATRRTDIRLEADVVVTRDGGRYVGVVPARTLMEVSATLQERRKRYCDPLTGMPGRVVFEQVGQERLQKRNPVALVRIDVDGFKRLNEAAGFEAGDDLIRELANLVQKARDTMGGEDDLVAHLGGDDFVLLTEPSRVEAICGEILAGFSVISPALTPASGASQQIEMNEDAEPRRAIRYPLRIAAQTNRKNRFQDITRMLDATEALLREVKRSPTYLTAVDALPGVFQDRVRRAA